MPCNPPYTENVCSIFTVDFSNRVVRARDGASRIPGSNLARGGSVFLFSNCFPVLLLLQVLTRCYTYVFCVACVSHWRGTWFLLDSLGQDAATVGCLWGTAVGVMTLTRSLRSSIMAPPLVIDLDGPGSAFSFALMFRSEVSRVSRESPTRQPAVQYYTIRRQGG